MMFLRLSIPASATFAVLFASAGRADVWRFWAYAGVILLSFCATYTILGRVSPALVTERMKPPSDHDRATRRLSALPILAHLVLAGLDVRFGWSTVPFVLVLSGFVLVSSGFVLVAWTLLTNPFASTAVRVQTECHHHVIAHGPYAMVRHPMYLAVLFVCLGAGPALGSWYSGLSLVPVIAIFVRRTLLEDRMLHSELDGYAAYASRVSWRVIPFVF